MVFSAREPEWGRHAEDKNKIIPTAKILRVIKFLLKVRENGRKRLKKKTLLKEWHKSVGFVKGKHTFLHFQS